MLKKQIRLNRENEGRSTTGNKVGDENGLGTQSGNNTSQIEREIEAASALVDVGSSGDRDKDSISDEVEPVDALVVPNTTASGTSRRRGKRPAVASVVATTSDANASSSLPISGTEQVLEKRRRTGRKKADNNDASMEEEEEEEEREQAREDDEDNGDTMDINEDQSDGGESDNAALGLDRALTIPAAEASEEEGLQYHVIRPLLSLPQYAHLCGTKSRPKLRCGMRDCRRHTSYYCVKCTRELQMQPSGSAKARIFALCSPMVENNFFCFYRHSLGLGERDKAIADELKAQDAQKPKKYSFHTNRQGNKKGNGAFVGNVNTNISTNPVINTNGATHGAIGFSHNLLNIAAGETMVMPNSLPGSVNIPALAASHPAIIAAEVPSMPAVDCSSDGES